MLIIFTSKIDVEVWDNYNTGFLVKDGYGTYTVKDENITIILTIIQEGNEGGGKLTGTIYGNRMILRDILGGDEIVLIKQ